MESLLKTQSTEFDYNGHQYRITLVAVSPLRRGKFYYYAEQVLDYLRAELGINTDDPAWSERAYATTNYIWLQRAAATLVSLHGVESRSGDKAHWKPDPFPDAWLESPMTFLDHVPDEFLLECEAVYHELNPGLFADFRPRTEIEQDAEKNDSTPGNSAPDDG